MTSRSNSTRLRTRALVHLIVVLAVALAAPAFAEETGDYMEGGGANKSADDFARKGGYLSLVAGGATQMFTGASEVPSNVDVSQAIIIGIRAGQRVNRYVALDASFDWSVKGFEVDESGVYLEAKSVTGFANLKLYPFGGRIQPYAFGGAGFLWGVLNCGGTASSLFLCDEDVVFAGRAGGGLDVYLSRHVALAGEVAYVIPTGYFSDLNFLQYTGAVVFRF